MRQNVAREPSPTRLPPVSPGGHQWVTRSGWSGMSRSLTGTAAGWHGYGVATHWSTNGWWPAAGHCSIPCLRMYGTWSSSRLRSGRRGPASGGSGATRIFPAGHRIIGESGVDDAESSSAGDDAPGSIGRGWAACHAGCGSHCSGVAERRPDAAATSRRYSRSRITARIPDAGTSPAALRQAWQGIREHHGGRISAPGPGAS